jgi:transposase
MEKISIIGLDLAKLVFQVHGADKAGRCLLRRQLKRREVLGFFAGLSPCIVAMEACGSAHYWAREIAKLGHEVRLVPPAYAKAYVKRGKSDSIDAEAICEAAGRPTMRFVPVKSIEQQSLTTLHRCRDLLVKNRTMLVNALRAHLAEFGFVAAKGISKLPDLAKIASEAPAEALPEMARAALSGFLDAIALINQQLAEIEKRLQDWHKRNAQSKRLATAPGVGLIGATALCALVPDPKLFKNGRHFAAWIGLTPKLDGTGGKIRLGRISKAGDGYLRRLFVLGATALLRALENKTTPLALWVQALLARRSKRAVTVALANKLARIAWAIMAKDEAFRPAAAAQLANAAGASA